MSEGAAEEYTITEDRKHDQKSLIPLFQIANLFSERGNSLKKVKTVRDSPDRI